MNLRQASHLKIMTVRHRVYTHTHTPTFTLPFDLGHRLAEVHVDASVIDQHVVHLEERFLTVLHLKHKRWRLESTDDKFKTTTGLNCQGNVQDVRHKQYCISTSMVSYRGKKKGGLCCPLGSLSCNYICTTAHLKLS